MAGFRVKIEGDKAILAGLKRANPGTNAARIATPALLEMMQLTLRIAAQQKIRRGGGGPPRPNILTSRTGTLRRSLSGSQSINKAGLPDFIEGGSNLVYAAVHEDSPRAFLKPALDDAVRQFDDIFIKWWERAL